MTRNERIAFYIVRFVAISELLAIPCIFLPFTWMAVIHANLGLGELPYFPIVSYLTRSLSAFYAFHGAALLFMSFDLPRYWPLIGLWGSAMFLFGVGILVLDVSLNMPILWTISEGPFAIIFGGSMVWLCWSGVAKKSVA